MDLDAPRHIRLTGAEGAQAEALRAALGDKSPTASLRRVLALDPVGLREYVEACEFARKKPRKAVRK